MSPKSRLRPLTTLLVVALLATGAVFAAASPVGAHTDDSPATGPGQDHPWSSDGCTVVLDTVPGVFEFTHACQHHDGCYGAQLTSRLTCDVRFLIDMRASCLTTGTVAANHDVCLRIAYVYFLGVRVLGGLGLTDVR